MTKPNYIPIEGDEEKRELEEWARRGEGWWVITQDELPSAIPSGLREGVNSAVVWVQGVPSNRTVVMVNNHRPDAKAWAIDQEPFGAVVYSSGVSNNGVLLHHGGWQGRTAPAPEGFWKHVQASGVQAYFPPLGLSTSSSGSLEDIQDTSHARAFDELLERLEITPGSTG